MTSVNELNAYNRGRQEGYKIGAQDTLERARREGTSLRWWKLIIAGLIGFLLAVGMEAHAQATAQTSVTVVISAEVPCNPTNCPEIPEEEPAQVENVTQDKTVLERIWSAILNLIR